MGFFDGIKNFAKEIGEALDESALENKVLLLKNEINKLRNKQAEYTPQIIEKENELSELLDEKRGYDYAVNRSLQGVDLLVKARLLLENKDFDTAINSYRGAVEWFKQAHSYAQEEFNEAVKNNPDFIKNLKTIIMAINENPSVLQKDIHKLITSLSKEDITFTLYFADALEVIERKKKGRTYELKIIDKERDWIDVK